MLAAVQAVRGRERYARALRVVSGVGGAALVAFHGWLLASQFAAGRLAEPGLVFRWVIAAALVAGLFAIHRSGASVWGRKGVAIWVLAAMLHGPAVVAASPDGSGALALPEVVATVVLQMAATAGSLALGLWLVARLIAAVDRRPSVQLVPVVAASSPLIDPRRRPFSPRPPPRA